MKKFYLILLALSFYSLANAQIFFSEFKDKTFNWGGKLGVNALFPIVESLTINDVEMEDVRMQYKVGYQATLFARINLKRFYLQPSVAWQYTKGDIRFNIPQSSFENNIANENLYQNLVSKNQIAYKAATLELPIMVGYYIIKEGPFALSVMLGPNLKYNYKTHYSTNLTDQARKFEDDNTPFGIGIATGVGVSIWRLFLDFNYEFGLNEVVSDFHEIGNSQNVTQGVLRIDKRTNIMSFSLGFLF